MGINNINKISLMQISESILFDESRHRNIPISIYLPNTPPPKMQLVLFNPGAQTQEYLATPNVILPYKYYTYLAEFFTSHGFAFVSIQHDLVSDKDGLETLDPQASQHEAREYLWKRGNKNIQFVLSELQSYIPNANLDKFIIAGHSNGADMAKYFANIYPVKIISVISLDGRRCRITPGIQVKLLMFEACDTSTDIGVIPNEGTPEKPNRLGLEYVIIKPKTAWHESYKDGSDGDNVKAYICDSIKWFLEL